MSPWLLLAVVVPLVLVLGVGLWIRALRMRALGDILVASKTTPSLICDTANCFGVQSAGVTQRRGNGCLALTDDQLLFRMWAPATWVRVPLHAITEVNTPRSHLGKSKWGRLLQVHWQTPTGPDSVAFMVKDLDRWVGALQRPERALPEHLDAAHTPAREPVPAARKQTTS